MAWTSTVTRSAGYGVTAAVWNAEHVENMQHMEEVAYAEMTSDLTVTNTTAATGQTVASAGAIVLEAVPHLITVSSPQVQLGANGLAFINFDLWDASTQLGQIGIIGNNAAALLDVSYEKTIRITPTAASHTYIWKAWRAAADGIVFAGTGPANDHYPAFIRIVRVPV